MGNGAEGEDGEQWLHRLDGETWKRRKPAPPCTLLGFQSNRTPASREWGSGFVVVEGLEGDDGATTSGAGGDSISSGVEQCSPVGGTPVGRRCTRDGHGGGGGWKQSPKVVAMVKAMSAVSAREAENSIEDEIKLHPRTHRPSRHRIHMAGGGSHMKKSCACCKRYLEHLGGKMSCFLIRMTTDYMHSMIIPDRFVNHFGGKIPGTIKLESPNGILYVVEVTECMNKMVLQCGWEAFVDAHHIKVGDSLLFRHIENSCFEVMILDSDGCERVFSCAGIKTSSCVQDKTVDPVDTSGRSSDDTAQPSRSERFARCQRDTSNDHRNTASLTAVSSSSEESENVSLKSNRNGVSDESQESEDSEGPAGPPYILSWKSKSRLSSLQKKIIKDKVRSIQSEVPIYVAIMNKSNIGLTSSPCQLELGARYAAAVHLPDRRQTMVLQRMGQRWDTVMQTKSGRCTTRRFLINGWSRFVRDNRLGVGDICLLELKKHDSKLTMTVHTIFSQQS